MLHFVGFRGDEYNRAIRVFGPPDFIHRDWDWRAFHEVAPGDVVVFGPKGYPSKGHLVVESVERYGPAIIYNYTYDDSSFF